MFSWIDNAWHSVTGRISSDIANWVHDLIRGLYTFLSAIFLPVSSAWDWLYKNILNYHAWIGRLVDEVYRAMRDAYDWINKEGYLVYYYISYPASLVDRIYDSIIAKIEATAESTAEKLGRFTLALIVKNVKTIVTVVEDIVDAIM
jgi:hypothetical protein